MNLFIAAAPKSFVGHAKVIQTNAIESWKRIPSVEICLFGDDETAAVARALGVAYRRPNQTRKGLPLLDSIFSISRDRAEEYICYVNADIILLDSFIQALRILDQECPDPFLMVGRRTNLEVTAPLTFEDPFWQQQLSMQASAEGELAPFVAIDFFLFKKELFRDIPPLRIGRAGFDNYLLYRAHREGVKVIDVTHDVLVVHQNHDYSHVEGGKKDVWEGEDAMENLRLIGGFQNYSSLLECDFYLRDGVLVENIFRHLHYVLRQYRYVRGGLYKILGIMARKVGI